MIPHDSVFGIIHWEWFCNDSAMILYDFIFGIMWAFPKVSVEKQYENLAIHTALQYTSQQEESSTKLSIKHCTCTRKRHSFALILVHALACPVEAKISAPAHISKLYPVATKLSPGFQVFELFGAHSRAFEWLNFAQKCLAMNSTCQSQSNRLKPEC
jgi:hypothetical protein